MHISENQVEGSLEDTSVGELLDACHKALVTGTIKISASKVEAKLELRAGAVDSVEYRGMNKLEALAELRKLKSGSFELTQRLPTLGGELGSSARLEGSSESSDVSVIGLMQHCEENALSCTIVVVSGFDRAEIHYRAGEIEDVVLNGESNPDKIVDVVRFEDARFRITPPPLDLGILTWPVVRKDPTPPFGVTALGEAKEEEEEEAGAGVSASAGAGAGASASAGASEAEDEEKDGASAGESDAEDGDEGEDREDEDEDEDEGDEDEGEDDEDEDDEEDEDEDEDDEDEDEGDEDEDEDIPSERSRSGVWLVLVAAVLAIAGYVGYQLYLSMSP